MAETSDKISSLAARYATITPARLLGQTAKDEGLKQTAADIRSLAASALRQDEVKGVRKLFRKLTGG